MVLSDRPHPSQVQVASRLVKTQPKKWPESRQRKAANVINAALRKLILPLRENTPLRMDQGHWFGKVMLVTSGAKYDQTIPIVTMMARASRISP